MAGRKKKSEPIRGVGRDPDNQLTVQKSRPLYALWRSGLTLAEFKILDTYLARINSRNPDDRVVILEKGKLEDLLGVEKINNTELEQRLKHLMGNVVRVDDPTKTKSYRLVTLFEQAEAEQDENGLWQVHLECTQAAKKYFFNVDNLGYLRYKLRCITSISSRYTYIMFIYLESNRFRSPWEVSVEELKKILNCEQEATYKEFKFFNVKILKRVQKELTEKTELHYTYEPIKKGRAVTTIRFTLETLPELEVPPADVDPDQLSLFETADDPNAIFAEALPPEFTAEEVETIKRLVLPKIPCDPHSSTPPECVAADYLRVMVARMDAADKKKPIKSRFKYLYSMISNDRRFTDVE